MAEHTVTNGVDVTELGRIAGKLKGEPELAKFRFHVSNKWIDGGHTQTTVTDFHGVGEDIPHDTPFVLEAAEPHVLLGGDEGANPVEHLLHALVSCLTGALVYHAATRGVTLEEVESVVEGDLDMRGFMGLADGVRKGYQAIRVTLKVKADAPAEKLEECARFSPVLDVLMNGTRVDLKIETT